MVLKFYKWIAISAVIILDKCEQYFTKHNYQNEQWYLDLFDNVNEISVR